MEKAIMISMNEWSSLPDKPLAALHIIHGMMEHSARYREFAGWLSEKGIAVYSADLPGHGQSVELPDDLGHIGEDRGWEGMLNSVRNVQDSIRSTHPGIPVFILGHSFGSVVARSFSQQFIREYPLAGVILSGAMQQSSGLLKAGLGLIAIQNMVYGSRHRSKLMIRLGYGQYAKYFKPKRTDFDWLSSDPAVVDDYLADPKCGRACTLGFYQNMFLALLDTWSCRNIRKLPHDLSLLLLGGEMDPALRFGADTRNLQKQYERCGMKKTEVKLFAGGRHEMLNESNKKEAWEYILGWLIHNSTHS